MTRHLFKLVWNRKRTNGLMILEIFFSFLVVFVVVTLGIYFWDNYRQPLGYSWQNVWKVTVDMKAGNQDDDATVWIPNRSYIISLRGLYARATTVFTR